MATAKKRGRRADISLTDLKKAVKYLEDAAKLYDSIPGLRSSSRAWCIRQHIQKLKKATISPTN